LATVKADNDHAVACATRLKGQHNEGWLASKFWSYEIIMRELRTQSSALKIPAQSLYDNLMTLELVQLW